MDVKKSWVLGLLIGCASTALLSGCAVCGGCVKPPTVLPKAALVEAPLSWGDTYGRKVFHFGPGRGGKPVILLHELPGLSNYTIQYAETLGEDFSVYVPLLFGEPGQFKACRSVLGYYLSPSWWTVTGRRPVLDDLHALASEVASIHSGESVRVVGMCLTGSFPLSLLTNEHVTAAVCAQPTLPLFSCDEEALGIPDRDLAVAISRVKATNAFVFACRFEGDTISKPGKLRFLSDQLGPQLMGYEITQTTYRCGGETVAIRPDAHSTLTGEWRPGLPPDHPVPALRAAVREFLLDPKAYSAAGVGQQRAYPGHGGVGK